MKSTLTLFVYILVATIAFTQSSLSGKLYDSSSIEEQGYTYVSLFQDSQIISIVETDSLGKYLFQNLKLGNYTVEVDVFGFEKLIDTIILKDEAVIKNYNLQTKQFILPLVEVIAYKKSICKCCLRESSFSHVELQNIFLKDKNQVNTEPIVSAYPNPTTNYIKLKSKEPITEIKLYDKMGKLIYFDNDFYEDKEIPMQNLLPDLYVVECKLGLKSKTVKAVKY